MACCLTAKKKKKEKTNKKLRLISYNQISIKRKKKVQEKSLMTQKQEQTN